jgi:hypothetical protein
VNAATTPTEPQPQAKVSPGMLWFGVLGGVVAWTVQMFMSWSTMELACVGNGPGLTARITVWVSTGVPWLVTVAASVAVLRERAKIADLPADDLAVGRVSLLTTVGLILDLFSLGIITAGGIALLVLRPCS